MASTRFPGKPLKEIRGLPMVEHVRRRALLSGAYSEVWVATCDREIARCVRRYGGKVRMTSAKHPAATDRVREAAQGIRCSHVVNVQGDEILVLPRDLKGMVSAILRRPEIPAWNAVGPIEREDTLRDRSVVKCILSTTGRILLCTRDAAWLRQAPGGMEPVRSLLGILGYRVDFLGRYGRLKRTPLEKAESVDQSRIIEHDHWLQSVPFRKAYVGINHPQEVAQAEKVLASDPHQRAVLKEILNA
jgi:3-deoxy-manno-octulosonate cytidylyltransferase (CMP-KDO synthetase)